MGLLVNDCIMLGTLIWSFRLLEHQNPSINLVDIGRARSVQQFRNGGGTEEERRSLTVVLEDRIN